jgi:AbiEi antitoxin C-terminal domain
LPRNGGKRTWSNGEGGSFAVARTGRGDTKEVTPRVEVDSLSINVGGMRAWLAAGLTMGQFRSRVRTGELVRLRRGVYATPKFARQAEENAALRHVVQVAAATNAQYTRGAVASHQSAALLHGIDLFEKPAASVVWLTRPPGRYRNGAVQGVRFHSATVAREHVTTVLGIRVTTPARTVVDLARSLPFMEGVVTADAALHAGLTTRSELRQLLAFFAGWPGSATARHVVEFSDPLAESVLESAARVIFAERGLPAPRLQVSVLDAALQFIGRVDFRWEEYRTIAEADGMAKYEDPERAREQIRRDTRLREAGNKVVHFTWAELFGDPARVIARIRAAFGARSGY